ncbi:MAG: hypothetical protein ACREDT_07630 [Methylocella sp.]
MGGGAKSICMQLTEINLAYYQDFMEDMRHAIVAGRFDDFRDARPHLLKRR